MKFDLDRETKKLSIELDLSKIPSRWHPSILWQALLVAWEIWKAVRRDGG